MQHAAGEWDGDRIKPVGMRGKCADLDEALARQAMMKRWRNLLAVRHRSTFYFLRFLPGSSSMPDNGLSSMTNAATPPITAAAP